MMPLPIILTAFGTRKDSRKIRDVLEAHFRKTFPAHDFYWAFASRCVQQHRNSDTPPPPEVLLQQLADVGHSSVILQSLHMVCATEFHRLLPLCHKAPLKVTLGLPLLSSLEDCQQAALGLGDLARLPADTAVVLVLHGSHHTGAAFFHLLGKTFMEIWGERAFYGMLEGEPGRKATAKKIRDAGFSKAKIIPFTLVTGYHFEKDLMGDTNSWRSTFLETGLIPDIHPEGVGLNPAIVEIFCQHLKKALFL